MLAAKTLQSYLNTEDVLPDVGRTICTFYYRSVMTAINTAIQPMGVHSIKAQDVAMLLPAITKETPH